MTTSASFPVLPALQEGPPTSADDAVKRTRRHSLRRLRSKSLTRFKSSSSSANINDDFPGPSKAPIRPPLPTDASSETQQTLLNEMTSRPSTSMNTKHEPLQASSSRGSNLKPAPPPQPPAWPAERQYCACYCEENAYLLAQQLDQSLVNSFGDEKVDSERGWKWDIWVVVVSNQNKTVLLWQQRASQSPQSQYPVVWDYHQFVVVSAKRTDPVSLSEVKSSSSNRPSTVHGDRPNDHDEVNGKVARRRSLFAPFKRRSTAPKALSTTDSDSDSAALWHAWVYDIDSVLCYPLGSGDKHSSKKTEAPSSVPFKQYVQGTFTPPAPPPSEFLPTFRLVRADAFFDNFASDRSHMLVDDGEQQQYASSPPSWPPIVGQRAKRKGWTNNLMKDWVNVASAEQQQQIVTRYQFGKVMSKEDFYAGKWDLPEWRTSSKRRTAKEGQFSSPPRQKKNHTGAVFANDEQGEETLVADKEPPSIQRVTSWNISPMTSPSQQRNLSLHTPSQSTVHLPPSPPALKRGETAPAGMQSTVDLGSENPPIEPRKGGRVTSPLFPAYMHAVYQHRAARKRDSYLALRGQIESQGLRFDVDPPEQQQRVRERSSKGNGATKANAIKE